MEYVDTNSGAWGGATITITYTDGRVLTIVLGSSSMNSPGASSGGKTITVTGGTVKSDGKVAKSSAAGGTWPITGYSFKGNNGSTVSPTESKTVTVTFADASGCVTADTMVALADGWERPEGFCSSAWQNLSPYVMALAHGGGDFYDGWMKDPKSAMISCNDGFRPVSFYLEALEEDADG